MLQAAARRVQNQSRPEITTDVGYLSVEVGGHIRR